jgi:pseudoazurin
MKRLLISFAAIAMIAVTALSAGAAEIEVRMLRLGSNGAEMVFEPALIQIGVGDTVTFIPADPTLNVATIMAMLPEGAAPVRSHAGERVAVTFTVPGAYGFKSSPGYVRGMVGLVLVGDVNPQSVDTKQNPKTARDRFEGMLASLQ